MIIATTGNESPQHQRAKIRLKQIVTEIGIISEYEIRTGTTETALGTKNFTIDLFGFWTNAITGVTEKIAFEVRGYKGHNTRWAGHKDRCRDIAHSQKGIKTVRINMLDLVGKKKVDDETIKRDILWQLSNQN